MSQHRSEDDARDEALRVLRLVDITLGTSSARSAGDRLAESLHQAHEALNGLPPGHRADKAETTVLLTQVRAASLRLEAVEVVRRREAFERLQVSLRHLQQFDSTAELAERVPDEVANLGFNRVLFSWVDHARWVPVSFHTRSGPNEARAVMAAAEPPYWDTHRLLENEMVAQRRPMLVRDALHHPRVHLDIQAVMQSHSYVAAPVVRRAQVVGFVHADQNTEFDVVDDLDRDLINLFAQGLSLALDRVAMLEELAELRRRIGEQALSLNDLLVDNASPRAGAEHSEVGEPRVRLPGPPWRHALTRREEEVLSLIAAGLSNGQIAQRIYVTEGTAKTHVKNVLRKLGAESRAHAGALYHQHWQVHRG